MSDQLLDRVTVAVGEHYLIDGEIGRGGMSVVYRAHDLRLNRPVAIKVLPPELAFNADVRTRFIREAQTAAQLAHPNIVPIYSVDEAHSMVYFVMALVDGESIGAQLARVGAFDVDGAVRVLRDVADALAYAHEHGVIHRDVKPDNVLIDRASGRAMVTDFGIARAIVGETRLTATGAAVGTPAYMSPEQAIGEREVDGRSDIYSLGVVGFQMLAGETPFKAVNTPAMLVKHVSERPRPIRDVRPDAPAYLAVAIDRALSKRPEDRWSSAAELRDALASGHRSVAARSGAPAEPQPLIKFGIHVRAPEPPLPPAPVSFSLPVPPPELSRKELRRWYKEQRRELARQMVLQGSLISADRKALDANIRRRFPDYDSRPLEDRVIAFRRSFVTWMVTTPILIAANASLSGGGHSFWDGPWFIIPSGIMFVGVLRRLGSIWSDGVGPIDAFKKGIRARIRAQQAAAGAHAPATPAPFPAVAPPRQAPQPPPAALLAGDDVLRGPHGEAVRRAMRDRDAVREIVASLRPFEREMIPDVLPTVGALAERVGTLATTLHRLDADVSGSSLGALDERIAGLRNETRTPEGERRLGLLERQRASLRDLLDRRRALSDQLESASLALLNLKLDLLKLRSSGVGAAIEDVTSATQEARALSRDIASALEVGEDLRRL